MRRSGGEIFLLVLKILVTVVMVAFLVWATIDLSDQYIDDMSMFCGSGNVCFEGYGLTFAAFLILGFMVNGGALILSLIGLIVSIAYKSSFRRKGNIIAFVLLMIAPVACELMVVLIAKVIPVIIG